MQQQVSKGMLSLLISILLSAVCTLQEYWVSVIVFSSEYGGRWAHIILTCQIVPFINEKCYRMNLCSYKAHFEC